MTRRGISVIAIAALSAGLLAAGCKHQQAAPAEAGPQPIVKTDDRGPIKLSVTADRDKLTIADQLTLTIAVESDPGFEVEMPDLGAQLAEFRIRDVRTPAAESTPDKKQVKKQIYKLDVLVSGSYTVPAITAHYSDHRKEGTATPPPSASDSNGIAEAPRGELTTEPLTVEVTSLHEGDFDPAKFRDVRQVATLSADWSRRKLAFAGIIVGGVGAMVALGLLIRGRMGRQRPVIVIPPHEWAFQQLAALAEARLVEEGRIKEFFYRLSEIARTYIELRFGLMAPERTTEEFLEEMRSSNALPQRYQPALSGFLEACDMVKYALYEPTMEEIERAFNSARDFVAETRPQATPVAAEQPLVEAAA